MKNILKSYLDFFSEDKNNLKDLEKFLENNKNIFDRKNFNGHIVANALILNGTKTLTLFHKNLQMYLQPGGHVDEWKHHCKQLLEKLKKKLELKI